MTKLTHLLCFAFVLGCGPSNQVTKRPPAQDAKSSAANPQPDTPQLNLRVSYDPKAPFPSELDTVWHSVSLRHGQYTRLKTSYGTPYSDVRFTRRKGEVEFHYQHPGQTWRLAPLVNVERLEVGYLARVYWEYSNFHEVRMRSLDEAGKVVAFDFRTDAYLNRKDTMMAVAAPGFALLDSLVVED